MQAQPTLTLIPSWIAVSRNILHLCGDISYLHKKCLITSVTISESLMHKVYHFLPLLGVYFRPSLPMLPTCIWFISSHCLPQIVSLISLYHLLSGSLLPCSDCCEFVSSWAHQSENICAPPRPSTSRVPHFLFATWRNARPAAASLGRSGNGAWLRVWLRWALTLRRVSSSREKVDRQRSEWVYSSLAGQTLYQTLLLW